MLSVVAVAPLVMRAGARSVAAVHGVAEAAWARALLPMPTLVVMSEPRDKAALVVASGRAVLPLVAIEGRAGAVACAFLGCPARRLLLLPVVLLHAIRASLEGESLGMLFFRLVTLVHHHALHEHDFQSCL